MEEHVPEKQTPSGDDPIATRKEATANLNWRTIGIALALVAVALVLVFLAFGEAEDEGAGNTAGDAPTETGDGSVDTVSGD